MDQHYDELRRHALDLHNQLSDRIDDHDHPTAHVLQHETRQLVEDIESKKNPHAIEERIKQIEHHLQQVRYQEQPNVRPMMSHGDLESLHHAYMHQREMVRRLPNF